MDATPHEVEADIRDTWGVAVLCGPLQTWGHLDTSAAEAFGALGGRSTDDSAGIAPGARVLRVARGILPSLASGTVLLVDGVPEAVRAARPDRDRAFELVLLADWTHRIQVFRPATGGVGVMGRRSTRFDPVGPPVPANLIVATGGLEAEDEGQEITARASATVAPGTDVQTGDFVLVIDGAGDPLWHVVAVMPRGVAWDTELLLERSTEEFGA